MNKRICSLETEYALVSHLPAQASLSRDELAGLIEKAILSNYRWVRCNSFGRRSRASTRELIEIREGQFIENGSRVYYDVGHFEWANPETIDPRSAVLYERAAERTLAEVVMRANQQLRQRVPNAWVMLIKNNIDYHGDTSYGCHENYSLQRYDRNGQEIFARLADELVPFLVTRQIFCGTGRLGARQPQPDDPVGFQLSPRADFMELLESSHTREERGILNLRDEPLADPQQWRRLHLILGDSNISELATFLKIGTTSLVLDLVEAGAIGKRWALRDPVSALHRVSRDWRHAQLSLRQRGKATALTIQRAYWQLARQMVLRLPTTHFAHQIIKLWGQTLDDLETGHSRLTQRLDWAIKSHYLFTPTLRAAGTDWDELRWWDYVIERTRQVPLPPAEVSNLAAWAAHHLSRSDFRHVDKYLRAHALDWQLYRARRRLLNRLREMDLRYHDVNPDKSLFALLARRRGKIERMISDEQIKVAQRRPPQNTRAWQRGEIIKLSHARKVDIELDWDKVLLLRSNRTLAMADPFTPNQINLDNVPEFYGTRTYHHRSSPGKKIQIRVISVESLE